MRNKRLDSSLKKFSNQKQEAIIAIAGTLGLPLNGQKLVEVPNRKGFVYVKLRDNQSEVIQAYNSEVSNIYGLAVLVARQGNIYRVIGRDLDRYRDWGSIPYLPKHGGQHSFNQAFGMGADVTWIYTQQMMPLLGYPSGSVGSNGIVVAPYLLRDLNGNWKYAGNTGTPDITMYRPTVATGAVMVLVYVDTVSGNPYLLVGSGSMFHAGLTGTGDIAPFIPHSDNPNWMPNTAVRLVTGTTVLTWTNLYDVRPFLQVVPTGSAGSGGGGAGSFGFVAWDEGVFLGTGSVLNFTGPNVQATISGSVVNVYVTGSTGGGVNTGTLDARYLKLDASNAPVTGYLPVWPTAMNTTAINAQAKNNGTAGQFTQFLYSGSAINMPTVQIARATADNSSPTVNYPMIYAADSLVSGTATTNGSFISYWQEATVERIRINPNAQGTGTLAYLDSNFVLSPDGLLLLLMNNGSPQFHVNASGTAYSNGVPLVKEAPTDGQQYARKNAGWEPVTSSGGGGSGTFILQENGLTLGSASTLNAGNRITATLSGTVALIEADTVLLQTDDFTTQINGTVTTFGPTSLLPVASTARLYYNGVRQRYNFHYTLSGSYVQTLFTPTTGSVLLLDYNESSTTGTLTSIVGVQDEGVLKGNATILNFVGANVSATVAGQVATINVTGSTSAYGDFIAESRPSGTSTVTFSGIPSTYKHLRIEYIARSTKAGGTFDQLSMMFNNDTVITHYRHNDLYSFGASSVGSDSANDNYISYLPNNGAPANEAAVGTIFVNFYAETIFNKIAQNVDAGVRDASSVFLLNSKDALRWSDTSAINRIDYTISGTFVNGSVFRLYGIY